MVRLGWLDPLLHGGTARRGDELRAGTGVALVLIAVVAAALAAISLDFCRFGNRVPAVWPANALPLALLLVRRPAGWRLPGAIITASAAGIALANLAAGAAGATSVLWGVANGLEIAGAAMIAWLPLGVRPRLRRVDGLLKLALAIGIAGPALGALIGAAIGPWTGWSGYGTAWLVCFASHALGNLIFTAGIMVLLDRTHQHWWRRNRRLSVILALAICLVLLTGVLQQSSPTPLFLMPLLFAFLGVVAGFEISCVGVIGLAVFALWRTAAGHGPIVALEPESIAARILILQSLIGAGVLSSVPIALAFERRARMIAQLRRQKAAIIARAAHYKLLADVSADTILVTLQDGTILYASPAAARLLGIAGSALTGRSAFDLIHPDDKTSVRRSLATLCDGTPEVTTELRLQPNGSAGPIWTEVKTRIGEGKSGQRVEVVSVVRDISTRRAEDDRRKADLIRLDLLANTDPLTGLANRRRFNDHLDKEWRRALREQLDIALILIDVDLFKAYNDAYGHPAGDTALRQLATIVGTGALRPADLASRIGGEEFAVILPATFLSGARAVAERVRDGVRDMQIVHEKSPSGFLTVSVGIDCLCPNSILTPQIFIERADKALYRAKARRGSIVIAT